MSKLSLEQFKTDNQNVKANDSRLSLDQFKAQTSNNVNNEELEKLTGGVLGACHMSDLEATAHALLDVFGLGALYPVKK